MIITTFNYSISNRTKAFNKVKQILHDELGAKNVYYMGMEHSEMNFIGSLNGVEKQFVWNYITGHIEMK